MYLVKITKNDLKSLEITLAILISTHLNMRHISHANYMSIL